MVDVFALHVSSSCLERISQPDGLKTQTMANEPSEGQPMVIYKYADLFLNKLIRTPAAQCYIQ